MHNQRTPVVSVVILAYNHGRFIRQSVESALGQIADFPVEIIVGDDASTDDTPRILRELDAAHPGRLTLRLRPVNLGANANFADLISACGGEFVAILEGDDYWTYPHKLASQVGFLRAHPDCALCFHDAEVRTDGQTDPVRLYCTPKPSPFSEISDIIRRNIVPTCSVVYRRELLSAIPASIRHLPMQDWPCWTLLAQHGRLGFIDRAWACYRLHQGGIWSSKPHEYMLRKALGYCATMRTVLAPEHRRAINISEKDILAGLVAILAHEGRWREAAPFARRYLILAPGRWRAPAGKQGLYLRIALGLTSRQMRQVSAAQSPAPNAR